MRYIPFRTTSLLSFVRVERDIYYLTDDKGIFNQGSSSAESSCVGYYTYENGEWTQQRHISVESDHENPDVSYMEVDEEHVIKNYITHEGN